MLIVLKAGTCFRSLRNLVALKRKEYLEMNYDIDDEEIARIFGFCQLAEIDFHHLAGPRNVSIVLKYEVLCYKC